MLEDVSAGLKALSVQLVGEQDCWMLTHLADGKPLVSLVEIPVPETVPTRCEPSSSSLQELGRMRQTLGIDSWGAGSSSEEEQEQEQQEESVLRVNAAAHATAAALCLAAHGAAPSTSPLGTAASAMSCGVDPFSLPSFRTASTRSTRPCLEEEENGSISQIDAVEANTVESVAATNIDAQKAQLQLLAEMADGRWRGGPCSTPVGSGRPVDDSNGKIESQSDVCAGTSCCYSMSICHI